MAYTIEEINPEVYERGTFAEGDLAELGLTKAEELFNKGKDLLKSGLAILEDPALPEITGLVLQLKKMEAAKGNVKSGEGAGKGIGLGAVVKPLKAFVFWRENSTWLTPLAIGGVIGAPFLLGFLFGRRRANGLAGYSVWDDIPFSKQSDSRLWEEFEEAMERMDTSYAKRVAVELKKRGYSSKDIDINHWPEDPPMARKRRGVWSNR